MGVHWKDWCWSWNSNTLATSCEELTHWKTPWCWEGLGAGGEGDDRGWDGWMASPTRWTWVWVNFGNWWWTGRPGMLRFMGSQRVRHDWATELNWTDLKTCPTRFPGAQSASLHPELPQGCWRSTATTAQCSVSTEADGKCRCCSVVGNEIAKCQFVVDSTKSYRISCFLPASPRCLC